MKRCIALLALLLLSASTAWAGNADPNDAWPHKIPSRGYTHFAQTWLDNTRVQRECGRPIAPEHRRGTGWSEEFQRCRMTQAAVRVVSTRKTPTSAPALVATSTALPTRTMTPMLPPTPIPPTLTPTPDTSSPNAFELNLMNSSRQQYGLPPYTEDSAMSGGSGSCIGSIGHSRHMAQTGVLAHDQFPSDVCSTAYPLGENIGYASGDIHSALTIIHNAMMSEPHSPGCQGNHACAITSQQFRHVGIGIVQSGGLTWLTVDFSA